MNAIKTNKQTNKQTLKLCKFIVTNSDFKIYLLKCKIRTMSRFYFECPLVGA